MGSTEPGNRQRNTNACRAAFGKDRSKPQRTQKITILLMFLTKPRTYQLRFVARSVKVKGSGQWALSIMTDRERCSVWAPFLVGEKTSSRLD